VDRIGSQRSEKRNELFPIVDHDSRGKERKVRDHGLWMCKGVSVLYLFEQFVSITGLEQ
jgi:hypothetical protein